MPIAAIIALIEQFGPQGITLVSSIVGWIESSGGTVTAADLAILKAYGAKKASDYLADAQRAATPAQPPASVTPAAS